MDSRFVLPRLRTRAHATRLRWALGAALVFFTQLIPIPLAPPVEASTNPAESEYWISVGPVNGSTSANYVYAAAFNPSGSGKTVIVKRIQFKGDAVGAATYQDLALRRITASSAGTLVSTEDIPKKNTASSAAVMELRHTGPTVTLSGSTNSHLSTVVAAAVDGADYSSREVVFGNNERLTLQPGEGIALYQPAAGDVDQRIQIALEWEETTIVSLGGGEYMLAYPRVENAAAVDYKYHTFFNPSGSGKTAVISQLNLDVDCDAASVYTNQIYVRRISAASAGTQVALADIPKKHTGSADSVIEARYLGVTATLSGTADSSIVEVTPCGAASQPHAHRELTFGSGNEALVIQPGEGIALVSSAAGDVDQLVRLSVIWAEQASAPSSQGEYAINIGPVNGSTTASYRYASFFNPTGSGKVAVIRRISVNVDTVAAATYQNIRLNHLTTAPTTGTVVSAVNVPKKHSGAANTSMDIRHTGTDGTENALPLTGVTGPGAVGQLNGHREIFYDGREPLVLLEGQGIHLGQLSAGDADQRIKLYIEWDEEASAPAAQDEFQVSSHLTGSTSAGFNYWTLFVPAASTKTVVVKRIGVRIDAVDAATYVPLTVQRITAASGGSSDTPEEKNSNGTDAGTNFEFRHAGPTATLDDTTGGRITSVTTPGAAPSAAAVGTSGYQELIYTNEEAIVLQPGQGIAGYQEAAGDADHRIKFDIEFQMVASAPASQGEHQISLGPVNGSTSSGYVYASLFNPTTSGKTYVIRRVEARVDAVAAATNAQMSLRKTSAASAGTSVTAANIPVKHTGSTASTAELRHTDVTTTWAAGTSARLLGITSPIAAGHNIGVNRAEIVSGDELVLQPGEGIALYQEAAGDADHRVRLAIEWSEVNPTYDQSGYRWFENTPPGAPTAALNTAYTQSALGQVRLRTTLHIDSYAMPTGFQNFKLQFATKSGTCAGSSYSDVGTASGAVRYYDNAGMSDGSAVADNTDDPTHSNHTVVDQTYEESNNFTSTSTISAGNDGLWEFALDTTNAAAATTYCFRIVKSGDNAIDTYSVYPEITTPPPTFPESNTAPNTPSAASLVQMKTDNTVLATGAWTNETTVKFSALASDPDASDTLQLCVEKDTLASSFSNTEDSCGTGVAYSGSSVTVTVTISGITDANEYHWQARVKDAAGAYSGWVSYGINLESVRDFGLDTTAPTGGTVYDGTSTGVDASFNDGSLSLLSANWSGFNANVSGLAKYQYSIGTTIGGTNVKSWTDAGRYADLPGETGDYLSTPDSPQNSVTGDIDLRIKVTPDDWTPGTPMNLITKRQGGDSFTFRLEPTGAINWFFWDSTGTQKQGMSWAPSPGFTDSQTTIWLRLTMDVDNGAGNYVMHIYTSEDGSSWTERKTVTRSGGPTSIRDTGGSVQIGAYGTNNEHFAGKVHYAEIRNGIGGAVVAKMDPNEAASSAATGWTSSSPSAEPWTVNQSGSPVATLAENDALTATGLTLQAGQRYYFNVRAVDNAGNTQSPVISSDGQLVAPTLTFSVSPSSVSFARLNAGNSYTDTQSVTITTSTNGYGGYVVRAFADGVLAGSGSKTLGMFNGGTYASPDIYQGSDIGFGFTSSDTSVQGANKFQPATCAGGGVMVAPGCFVPFSTTGPGDIVADHASGVTGTAISNEAFTISYRIKASALQKAGSYSTTVAYAATVVY